MTLASKPVVKADGLVIDTNLKCSRSEAQAMYDAGARVIVRYGPLPGNSSLGDLDNPELTMFTSIGYTVLMIQHPREPKYNTLNAATGTTDANHIISWALSIGYTPSVPSPAGVPPHLGLDMEGLKNPGLDSFAHAKSWVIAVMSAGFSATVYFGYDCGVTSAQADELRALGAHVVFWCDAGPFRERPWGDLKPQPLMETKYVLKQHMQSTLAGVGVDVNDVLQDNVLYGIADVDLNVPTTDPEVTV